MDKQTPYTSPLRTIKATAPVRICDNGGWTDTWFAEHGQICNIAIAPCVEVEIVVYRRVDERQPVITIDARNFGERYGLREPMTTWQKHPLLEAAIVQSGVVERLAVAGAEKTAVIISIASQMPPGAATGTSAAVCVALLAALDRLCDGQRTPHDIAYAAHAVETKLLGQQSGIQDQLAAAYGGISFIEMFAYPQAKVQQLALSASFLAELEQRLLLVYLGKPHASSAIHEMVIRDLEDAGPDNPKIEVLRQYAVAARDALLAEDLARFGQALAANTVAQAALHQALVSAEAQEIIGIAQAHGALGWKVNGAGGDGGS
ncbi:MAG: GHMP kinase, partial [Chloroflexota bacterium]